MLTKQAAAEAAEQALAELRRHEQTAEEKRYAETCAALGLDMTQALVPSLFAGGRFPMLTAADIFAWLHPDKRRYAVWFAAGPWSRSCVCAAKRHLFGIPGLHVYEAARSCQVDEYALETGRLVPLGMLLKYMEAKDLKIFPTITVVYPTWERAQPKTDPLLVGWKQRGPGAVEGVPYFLGFWE